MGGARRHTNLCKEKDPFPCLGEIFPLTEGLLMGDPLVFALHVPHLSSCLRTNVPLFDPMPINVN
jgi:hypothetical protein